ncbi:IS3 family transposase [Paenibacillus rhizoplanae]
MDITSGSEPKTSAQALRKAAVQERIRYHFNDHKGRYGSPKITRLLHQEGYTLTERTVSVYMRQNEAPLGGL